MSLKIHYIRLIRRWHARVGVFAALFLILLVFTGLALNHEDALKLDKMEISSPWLMRWYGIHVDVPTQGYLLGHEFLSWYGDKWVWGTKVLNGRGQPVGAIEISGIAYIATASQLYMFQQDGQLLDKVEKLSLPGYPIISVGKTGESVVLKTADGAFASGDGLNWEKTSADQTVWVSLIALPDKAMQQQSRLLAPGLPAQRILLDLHSGRLFGQYGPWVMDFVALALLTLGMSGVWIYWRSVKQGRLHNKSH